MGDRRMIVDTIAKKWASQKHKRNIVNALKMYNLYFPCAPKLERKISNRFNAITVSKAAYHSRRSGSFSCPICEGRWHGPSLSFQDQITTNAKQNFLSQRKSNNFYKLREWFQLFCIYPIFAPFDLHIILKVRKKLNG